MSQVCACKQNIKCNTNGIITSLILLYPCEGHNLAEMVSVQAYLCSETTGLTWVGRASLEFFQDDAQVWKNGALHIIFLTTSSFSKCTVTAANLLES